MFKIDALKTLLGIAFDMKDLGGAKKTLAIYIIKTISEGSIFLSQ